MQVQAHARIKRDVKKNLAEVTKGIAVKSLQVRRIPTGFVVVQVPAGNHDELMQCEGDSLPQLIRLTQSVSHKLLLQGIQTVIVALTDRVGAARRVYRVKRRQRVV